MTPAAPADFFLDVNLSDEAATGRLAHDFARLLLPGDFVALSGDLGSGKTAFARYLIRHICEDPALEVPSPTFTLIQSYDYPRGILVHADFHRLKGDAELAELGWEEVTDKAITLVEWTENAPASRPADRLDLTFFIDPAFLTDPDAAGVEEITLSYTFFAVPNPRVQGVAASLPGTAGTGGGVPSKQGPGGSIE